MGRQGSVFFPLDFHMASQILLNPIGSAGDVFPFLALGRELQKRGHHVAVMTNRLFIENIGQAGLEFIEVGTTEALRAVGKDPRLHRSGNAWKLALKWGAVGTMRQSFEIIRQRIKKCDTMVVAPCTGFGARIAAEKFKVPLATIVLSPFVIRSVHQSPLINPMVLGDWVPRFSKQLQFWIADRFFIDPLFKSDVAAFRQESGLATQSRLLHRWCFSDDLTLALFPEFFAPPQPDWPANTHLTGPISWDPPNDPQAVQTLAEFIKPGRKPIVVLAGSAGPESNAFYDGWIQATKKLDRQMILLEKNHNKIPTSLPDHVFHARYFPIDQVLDRAALIAHSGGVGTTLRSLKSGTPQILFPKVNDQPDNANRVRKIGVGRIIDQKHRTADQIAVSISEVIDDPVILANCASMRAGFTDSDPVQMSCDLIESTFDGYRKKT